MTEVLWKQATGHLKVLGKGRVEATMSTEAQDHDGDIIRQDHWDLSLFANHPVLMADHSYRVDHQIGRWDDVEVTDHQLRGVATYHVGKGNAIADWAYSLAEMGEAAYSVGFIPDMDKAKVLDDSGLFPTYEFKGQALLETSAVAIGSNPEALQRRKWAKSLADGDPFITLADIEGTTVDMEAAIEMMQGTTDLIAGFEDKIIQLRTRMGRLEQTHVDSVIEQLKREFPHLFTPVKSDLMEAVRQW